MHPQTCISGVLENELISFDQISFLSFCMTGHPPIPTTTLRSSGATSCTLSAYNLPKCVIWIFVTEC